MSCIYTDCEWYRDNGMGDEACAVPSNDQCPEVRAMQWSKQDEYYMDSLLEEGK